MKEKRKKKETENKAAVLNTMVHTYNLNGLKEFQIKKSNKGLYKGKAYLEPFLAGEGERE